MWSKRARIAPALCCAAILLATACSSADSPGDESIVASATSAPEPTVALATSAPAPTPTEESSAMSDPFQESVEPTVIDHKTAVFPSGTDIAADGSPPTSATPNDASVAAVLATLESAADLSWASGHTRLISGYEVEGSTTIRIDFSCTAELLMTPPDALKAVRDARSIDGGGACYGSATFTSTGELMQWRTNGES